MALSVRVEETVCVAGASATTQIVEANTMDPTVNVTMTTVRSFRTNNVEEKVNASVENVNVILALKALPVSARPLTRPAVP